LLRNVTQDLGLGWILWNDLDDGNRTWDLEFAGYLKTVASEFAKCNLDLVAVQEVRWGIQGGSQPADDYTLSTEMEMLIINQERTFLYIRESYEQLRG
jgi:hypothetical protein